MKTGARIAVLTFCLMLAFGIFTGLGAQAAPQFPALTGRVVDGAHLLSPSAAQSLTNELADYERGTTNQVVVVTLPSLKGYDIADYGYQLGRFWGIGQKGKDNGVLLIVAPAEHKTRIEVGYGLEPILTDAQSSAIIETVILPDFRAQKMQQGIIDGTHAILDVLGGKSLPPQRQQMQSPQGSLGSFCMLLLLFFIFRMLLGGGMWLVPLRFGTSGLNRNSYVGGLGGGGFGGSFGGGFSGGGGGFGGGGASGSW